MEAIKLSEQDQKRLMPEDNMAAVLNKALDVEIYQMERPSIIQPWEVLIRVDHTGICGSDLEYYKHGVIGPFILKQPMIMGHESGGTVLATGKAVDNVKPGDKVLFHAAAGGVGLIAGQWLKAIGATVIGTAGGVEKCALAMANGYDHVIDYNSTDFEAEVMRLTDGVGVDVAYDSVGNDTMARTITSTKRHGTIIAFGQSSGPYVDFKITDLAKGSYHLSRPTLFHFVADRRWLENAAAKLFELVSCGKITISINQRFPLKDVAKAHEALTSRVTTGCTVLKP